MKFEPKKIQPVKLLPLNIQFFAENKDNKDTTDLEKLQKDFSKSWKDLKEMLDTQADEVRTYGETTDNTAKSIKSIEDKLENYDKELKGFTDKYKDLETKLQRPDYSTNKQIKSVGTQLIESDAYKAIGETNRYEASTSFKSFYTKDLDSLPANGGVLTGTETVTGIIAPIPQDLRMRDLLNVQGTGSNSIEFIRETGFVNNAAMQVEKGLKAQSDLTFEVATAPIKTLAHWIPASRQIIQDATQLRNYVDTRLVYGLKLVEESQILYGDALGENLAGIMTNADIQNAGGVIAGDTMIDHIRRAITLSVLAGYPVTGIVLHPTDWATIELSKGTDGHYIWVSVTDGGQSRLWRVPVVESLSMAEGEFLLGAFGLGAQLWDREQANVRVSEHHADYFARNMLAILAEERLGLTIYRPESFVRGSFADAPTV